MGLKHNLAFTVVILLMTGLSYRITLENSLGTEHPSVWLIYVTGAVLFSGLSAVYPLGTKTTNEWGDKVRTGKTTNLSPLQSWFLLIWFIGGGALAIVYGGFSPSL